MCVTYGVNLLSQRKGSSNPCCTHSTQHTNLNSIIFRRTVDQHGKPAILRFHISADLKPNFAVKQNKVWILVYRHTAHDGTNSENYDLLHCIGLRVLEPQLSHVDAIRMVLMHILLPSWMQTLVHTACIYFRINYLTPELNPSAQRCLTRFFTGDFALISLIHAWKSTNTPIINSVY
jgi:hypothetical protein